jgi:inner membrane transporter RhtA
VAAPPAKDTRVGTGLVLCSMTSVQIGAALASSLFGEVGPAGAVLLRGAFGALVLMFVAGGRRPRWDDRAWVDFLVLGFIFAGMNLAFYSAIVHIPLGVVVTIEFVGPLTIAVAGSRRRIDLFWALLATVGIVLLCGGLTGEGLAPGGVALAVLAGVFWGAYILQSAKVGSRQPGLGGLAVSMAISVVFLAPLGIAEGGSAMLDPSTLLVGAAVGILASAIPYGLEHEALRRLPTGVFGILMSLEPAVAALVGLIALSEQLSAAQTVAIFLVVIASAGALRTRAAPPIDY